MLASAATKSRPPHSACTGAEIEMVTPGGEIAFISRMIDESVVLRERVQWYTSMLGKLSSVGEVVERLKTVGVNNWAVTEFVQGQKTRRWAVGWSWGGMRPRQVCHDKDPATSCRPIYSVSLMLKSYADCGAQHCKSTKAPVTVSMRIPISGVRASSSRAYRYCSEESRSTVAISTKVVYRHWLCQD